MGAKNLLVLKTHVFGSINISFVNDFVYGNMFWALCSLWSLISTVAVYFSGFIHKYILRFLQVGDERNEVDVQSLEAEPEANGVSEKLANFLFWSENFVEVCEERQTEIETWSSDSMEDSEKRDEETECSVLKELECDPNEDSANRATEEGEEHEEGSDLMESNSSNHEDSEKNVGVAKEFVFMEMDSEPRECSKNLHEDETECSGSMENGFPHQRMVAKEEEEAKKREEEEETEESVFVETKIATSTSKCEYMRGKDTISGFIEEPTAMSFSFREFYMGPYVSTTISHNNSCADTPKECSVLCSKPEDSVSQEETEDSVQEQGSITTTPPTLTPNTNRVPFWLESDVFGETDSSEEDNDDFLFNENSLVSDSESESSSSSGLIWGNGDNKFDNDSLAYEFLVGKSIDERFETKIMNLMMREDRIEGVEAKQSSSGGDDDGFIEMEPVKKDHSKSLNTQEENGERNGMKKSEEVKWEKDMQLNGPDSNFFDNYEDDLEWEHDDLVEQLKLELKNARQGGLATILEEDEEEIEEEDKEEKKEEDENEEEATEPLKPKMEGDEDLEQLEVEEKELHRDLELVYVGQVCLSWEILCWQHKKAQELQQEQQHQHHSHRYNIVAGEFQLFQVLLQRFIENEAFQGPRIHNYVKNRCVIRNLLQVPPIKDDSMKDRNMSKVDEEVPITSGRLADIIKECMRVYWEFVRADKDYGNVILKVSQQIGAQLKDPSISGLIDDMRAQLHKKEKWLKDLVRSGNCIVRKFQKHHELELDHEQLVAQVGLRLISRVLSMSKLRKEQVLWCNEKLHRIRFLSRKNVQVEPSFSLFPC
ncbi:hypothetical protein PIB30_001614 [Stylosanthes scabra]|uniref:Uncharacterized protein n=1 Tax=Stylosanthes scabra TaxID=79078 RepID=A0ABU6S3C5_9FABA|nr:hypothetical protein [Stylosanthes scabra]